MTTTQNGGPVNGYVHSRILKFQVGFLLAESRGTIREDELNIPRVQIAEDLVVDHLKGLVRFSRTSRGILVQGALHTVILTECTRCLDDVLVPLEVLIEDIYVYPPEPNAELTVADDGILDLGPLLREEIILEIPIGVHCRKDCAGLCPECGANLNHGPCDCDSQPINPKFAALLNLKDKLADE